MLYTLFWTSLGLTAVGETRLSNQELIERLTRLEEGQKALQKQIDLLQGQITQLQNQTNNQINGVRNRNKGA